MDHLIQDLESGLLRDRETGHLHGIEQKPVPVVPVQEFPKWKFRVVEKKEEGRPDRKVLETILIDTPEEESDIGAGWSDSRAEVVKGTELENARVHEHVVHKHQVIEPKAPALEEIVIDDPEA